MAFNLGDLNADFRNELNGGLALLTVSEGTVAGLVRPFVGVRGAQDLPTLDVSPTWKTNGQAAITSVGVSPFDASAGTVNYDRKVLSVEQEYFQAKVNPFALDSTAYALGTGNSLNPQMANGAEILEQAAKHMRDRVSSRFYGGYGSGTPTNGLLDTTFTTVNVGSGAVTAANIIAKLDVMVNTLAGGDFYGREDHIIILSASNYNHYRQAVRLAGLNDTLQNEVSESGMQVSPFITDGRISIVADIKYTGLPRIIQTDNVVFGTTVLTENEQPELFYDKMSHSYVLRAFVYGGVQAIETGGQLVAANA